MKKIITLQCITLLHRLNLGMHYHKSATISLIISIETHITSTTPSCSGPVLAQKSRGNSVLGVVFSHTIPKMDFHFSQRFSWEINTKSLNWYITCHGYINIHHSPCFHKSYKDWSKILKNYPRWIMEVILKNCPKNRKNDPFNRKWNLKKKSKVFNLVWWYIRKK